MCHCIYISKQIINFVLFVLHQFTSLHILSEVQKCKVTLPRTFSKLVMIMQQICFVCKVFSTSAFVFDKDLISYAKCFLLLLTCHFSIDIPVISRSAYKNVYIGKASTSNINSTKSSSLRYIIIFRIESYRLENVLTSLML